MYEFVAEDGGLPHTSLAGANDDYGLAVGPAGVEATVAGGRGTIAVMMCGWRSSSAQWSQVATERW